jgi:hypothetical protein
VTEDVLLQESYLNTLFLADALAVVLPTPLHEAVVPEPAWNPEYDRIMSRELAFNIVTMRADAFKISASPPDTLMSDRQRFGAWAIIPQAWFRVPLDELLLPLLRLSGSETVTVTVKPISLSEIQAMRDPSGEGAR